MRNEKYISNVQVFYIYILNNIEKIETFTVFQIFWKPKIREKLLFFRPMTSILKKVEIDRGSFSIES